MKNYKVTIGAAILVLAAIGWYLFRPELLFINKAVSEGFPGGPALASIEKGSRVITQGDFRGLAHDTKGTASIYQLADGKRTLRLAAFQTSNGPDVHVYLVAAPQANDNDTVKQAGFIDLGSLKGNIGDQNYAVPADVDLNKYRSVSIWCARFGVNFGSAALTAPQG